MGEIDGLARAGGAADNTGLSISLKSGGIPAANVPKWRSACPNPKGPGKTGSKIRRPMRLKPARADRRVLRDHGNAAGCGSERHALVPEFTGKAGQGVPGASRSAG